MLSWLLAMPALVCFVVAIVTLHFMRISVNRRLPPTDRISYFLPMTRWNRVTDAYKRAFPHGRAYLVWQASVIGTVAFVVAILLGDLWYVTR